MHQIYIFKQSVESWGRIILLHAENFILQQKDLACVSLRRLPGLTWNKLYANALRPFYRANLNYSINPLLDVPVLGSSTSATNKVMLPKIWTNGDTII